MKKYFLSFSLLLFLTACDDSHQYKDLKEYIAKVTETAAANSKLQKTPSPVPSPVPSSYRKESSRTPFEETIAAAVAAKNIIKHPVNNYPLNLLLFVGTVTENNKIWAYIMTPDKKLYQVTIGDMIGNQGGKILKITSRELEITEPVNNEEGKPSGQRMVTLQLKEEN